MSKTTKVLKLISFLMLLQTLVIAKGGGGGGGGGGDDKKSWKPKSELSESPFKWFKWQIVEYGKANPEIDVNQSCNTLSDCYNCTLSNCGWSTLTSSCNTIPGVNRSKPLTSTNFWKEAPKCKLNGDV